MASNPSPPTKARPGGSLYSKTASQLLFNIGALGLLAVVIVFVQATSIAESRSRHGQPLSDLLRVNVSTTLTVVRTAQGLLSATLAIALKNAFVFLHWKLMASRNGLPYLNMLAMSPTTDNMGAFKLISTSATGAAAKIWAFLRVTLTMLLGLSGLVLFFNTSIVTIYDTAETYDTSAGVGPFNASLMQPFIESLQGTASGYAYQILPFTYYAAVYILVANPLISTISTPVRCTNGSTCISYLLSGGLEMVARWTPEGYEEYPMVKIDRAPSVQLDFSRPAGDSFASTDCSVFGQIGSTIGIRVCIEQDQSSSGLIRAGLFVCTNGTEHGACETQESRPNITSTVMFYTRLATIVAARSNYSIVSVEDTTTPVLLADIDIPAYREALSWLLNYTAADIPPPSSIAQSFWSSGGQLQSPSTYGILEQNFQSILAFPFWLFNANNWANTALKSNETVPGMPSQFYTKASIVAPHTKIKFDPAMFIIFLVLQALIIVFVWIELAWICVDSRWVPTTSPFPLYDIAFRARVDGETRVNDMAHTKTSDIMQIMKSARATAIAQ